MDSRILVFDQYDDDRYFGYNFYIGFSAIKIIQKGEDRFDVYIDGVRFKDLLIEEKLEKQYLRNKKIEDEKKLQNQKKKEEQEYYNRALKYNGIDYYEGKEKTLLYNNKNNNNIKNNNNFKKINNNVKSPIKYDYDYCKQNNKNNYYNNNNNYNNFINNNNNKNNYNYK